MNDLPRLLLLWTHHPFLSPSPLSKRQHKPTPDNDCLLGSGGSNSEGWYFQSKSKNFATCERLAWAFIHKTSFSYFESTAFSYSFLPYLKGNNSWQWWSFVQGDREGCYFGSKFKKFTTYEWPSRAVIHITSHDNNMAMIVSFRIFTHLATLLHVAMWQIIKSTNSCSTHPFSTLTIWL